MTPRLLETKRTEFGPVALLELQTGRHAVIPIDHQATRIPEIALLPGVDQVRVAALQEFGIQWRRPAESAPIGSLDAADHVESDQRLFPEKARG